MTMRTVWKYLVEVRDGEAHHRVPQGATIVGVGLDPAAPPDSHIVAIWADVTVSDAGQPGLTDDRHFLVTGTGYPMPPHARYLGLVLDESFAWHVWEL